MEYYAEKIARALDIRGLINIQFAIKGGKVFVIEANPRASRTTPFIAKAYQVPYLNIATKVMLGANKLTDFTMRRNWTALPSRNRYSLSTSSRALTKSWA